MVTNYFRVKSTGSEMPPPDPSGEDFHISEAIVESSPIDQGPSTLASAEQTADEERQDQAFDSLFDFAQDLSETKSPEVSRYFLQRLSQLCSEAASSSTGKVNHEALNNLVSEIEAIPDLLEMQEKALENFTKIGAIRFLEDGTIVANLDKIRNLPARSSRKLGAIHWSKFYGNNNSINAMYFAFKGRKVISEADYQQGIQEGKPLFYSPASSEEASDLEAIKKADFYLGLWEITGRVTTNQEYPSTEDKANFAEVSLACNIYNPQYGNGYRDEATGKLSVFDQDSQDYRPVSAENIFHGSFGLSADAQRKPTEYVLKSLPDLNRHGLLIPEDFKQIPGLRINSSSFEKRTISKGGSVMIDSIQYYLGKSKEFDKAYVSKVRDGLAVVFRGDQILFTFPLRDKGAVAQPLIANNF